MAVAERDEDRILLTTEFRERELVKMVPGVRWSTDEQVWWLPLSWAGCVQLRGVFKDGLGIGVGLNEWAATQMRERIAPCLALRAQGDTSDEWLLTRLQQLGYMGNNGKPALRPFQRAGVAFLATAGQALLADEMGLGKSAQAIAALEVIGDDAYPALIVCPSSMKLTWQEEFAKWAPHRATVVIDGSLANKRKAVALLADGKAAVGIVNYEALAPKGSKGGLTRLEGYGPVAMSDYEREPKELNAIELRSIVADEAHKLKNPRATTTRALWWLGKSVRYRFALTGTPIANSPEDTWTLMRFVSPPDFPAKTRFIERYALEEYNVFGFKKVTGLKSETREELFKIIDPRFIRRTKEMVLPELPPKMYSTRYVEMGAKQKKAYEEIRKEMMAQLESGTLIASSPLTKMTRLLQFASAFGDMGAPAYEVWADGARVVFGTGTQFDNYEAACLAAGQVPGAWVKDITPLLLTEPSCKVDALEEILTEIGDQRVLVFAESVQLIELAAARLVASGAKKDGPLEGIRIGQITGRVAEHERQENVHRFNAGALDALLVTLGAGGEGLSFPGCSTGVFLQRSFNFVKNAQAEDRIHGIGRGVEGVASEIIDVVTAGTAEHKVHHVRREKAEMLEELCRDEASLKDWLAK